MLETHWRSIIKALSWRFWATLITFGVSWLMTGQIEMAAKIGLADTLIKLGTYYAHERCWQRLKFGRIQPQEYQI